MTKMKTIIRRRLTPVLTAGVAALAVLAVSAPAATAAPVWDADLYWAPTVLQPGERGGFRAIIGNVGDQTGEGWPTVEVDLPEGVELDEYDDASGFGWSCSVSGTPQTVTCSNPFAAFFDFLWPEPNTFVGFALPLPVQFTMNVAPSAPTGAQPVVVRMFGTGATGTTMVEDQIQIGGPTTTFGARDTTFDAKALDSDGNPYTQAGGHPFEAIAKFQPNFKFNDPEITGNIGEMIEAVAAPKDILVELPAGFAGDPLAVPPCTLYDVQADACPPEAQVGVVDVANIAGPQQQMKAIYSVVPRRGVIAQFAFYTEGGPVLITPVLRSDGEWALRMDAKAITEANPVFRSEVRLWGIPADEAHDDQRCLRPSWVGQKCAGYNASGPSGTPPSQEFRHIPHSSTAPRRALITMPTECDGQPDVTTQHMASWLAPGAFTPDGDPDLTDPHWLSYEAFAPPVTGCENLEFEPSLKARPTTNVAGAPTGLDVELTIPQNMDPDGLATAHLKKAVVTLPEGLVINPAGANGLEACTEAQAHLGDRLPAQCPEASKVGTVQIETPILPDPIPGSIYVATPHANPTGSLLALYISLDDEKTGIVGKIPGKVTPNPQTGRLTAVFDQNPQLPFEVLKANFFGGAAATLRTPQLCGEYATSSELTPWSAPQSGPPDVPPADKWSLEQAPGGAACPTSDAQIPYNPTFDAGSTAPIAGAHTGFVVNLRREDGSRQFSSVTLTPPQGLVARLAGTPPCSDAALAAAAAKAGKSEQAAPSCPAASEVGSVITGAGAGPAPYYAPGKVYLAGPYKGAPLSLAIVTPAVAGPFDLGTIVVRTALKVDPKTAQITAVSDPIPQILEGIPLDIRSVSLRIDKPQFTLNPTSCDPSSVQGTLLSSASQSALVSSRFQVGECARLGFKPKMRLFLKGGTKRSDFPALRAVLTTRPGDANIKSVSVAMPPSEFLAQQHIRTTCTRVQFAADNCPKGSIYGTATVTTPLLDYKLTGPVYLRASDNPLPDLVPDLRGPAHQPIKLESAGRTDSVRKGIRNTFDFVPDAPFTKLVLTMQGGKKGLLENSRDICAKPYRARVSYSAHNGALYSERPKLVANCGKARKGAKGKKGRGGRNGQGSEKN